MPVPGDDRFFTELRGCTAELARIIDGDLDRPVPTCPGWTFRQLATHVGRGHRWAAQIVATRATMPIPMREVADGKLPSDPAQHAPWLNAGANQVIEARSRPLAAMWCGRYPASARPASGAAAGPTKPPSTWPTLSSRPDATSTWPLTLPRTASTNGSPASRPAPREPPTRPPRQRRTCAETARACMFTPPTPGCPAPASGWSPGHRAGVTVARGHGKADVAVRGPAVGLLLVLTRRLPPSAPGIEVLGEHALLTHWLQHTPF